MARQRINENRFAVYCDAAGFTPGVIDVHRELKRKTIHASKDQLLVSPAYADKTKVNEKLDITNWLPFAAKQYDLSNDIRDYFFVPVITIPSDLPNRNGVAFPLKSLVEFSVEDGMQAYKTFKGKPVHYEHCFDGSTLVLTDRGWKKIRKIRQNDQVMTDKGIYQKVTQVFINEDKKVSKIKALGLPTIKATSNHPFLVAKREEVLDGRKVRSNLTKDSFEYLPLSELSRGDYLVVPKTFSSGKESINPDYAFLTGLFAAEGSFRKDKTGAIVSAIFTLSFYEETLQDKVEDALHNLGLAYSVHLNENGGTYSVHVRDTKFAVQMKRLVGEYSASKKLHSEIRDWDQESLKIFIGAFISGDGSCKGKRMRARTSSKRLAYDLFHMMASLGLSATLNMDGVTGEHGRKADTYCLGLNMSEAYALRDYLFVTKPIKTSGDSRRSQVILLPDCLLVPIKSIEWNVSKTTVYNLEVEEDHTYIAGGVIVHNCNEDHTKAYGVIADAFLRKMDHFGNGKVWKLLELLAIDRTKYPTIAQKILDGEMNSYSMGAWVTNYTCSYCGAALGKCEHLHPKQALDFYEKDGKLVFRNVHGIKGFETSIVATPAYSIAASDSLLVK